MNEEVKLYKDCKWVERWVPISWSLRKCKSPKAKRSDLVGDTPPFASTERVYGNCGYDGLNWEPRK